MATHQNRNKSHLPLQPTSTKVGLFSDTTFRALSSANSPLRPETHMGIRLRPRKSLHRQQTVPLRRQDSENAANAASLGLTKCPSSARQRICRPNDKIHKQLSGRDSSKNCGILEPRAEVLALLVPSKQRSSRIALRKQAISQTSGCARLEEVSATGRNNSRSKNFHRQASLAYPSTTSVIADNLGDQPVDQGAQDAPDTRMKFESPQAKTRRPNQSNSSGQPLQPSLLGKRQRQPNRVRKDEGQIQLLIQEFKKCPDWTKEQVSGLAVASGLTESQVYKWAWDQKKKLQATANGLSQFLGADKLKQLQQVGAKAKASPEADSQMAMGQAEVTRDEFGGYCCKRWGNSGPEQTTSVRKKTDTVKPEAQGVATPPSEENICQLLGLDIDKAALDIVKADFKRKKIPLSKASKFLTTTSSAHSSAVKSYNASAMKSPSKPTPASTTQNSAGKGMSAQASAFPTYDSHVTPTKRRRLDSSQPIGERLFTQVGSSAASKQSAFLMKETQPIIKRAKDKEMFLTPLNDCKRPRPYVDPILDDDFGDQMGGDRNMLSPRPPMSLPRAEQLFKTPSPKDGKPRFDLSDLDKKLNPETNKFTLPPAVDAAQDPAALNKEKERVLFGQMLGASVKEPASLTQLAKQDSQQAFQAPVVGTYSKQGEGKSSDPPLMESPPHAHHPLAASFMLNGAIMKTNLSPLQSANRPPETSRSSPFMQDGGGNVAELNGFEGAAFSYLISHQPAEPVQMPQHNFTSPVDPTVYLCPVMPMHSMLFPPRLDSSALQPQSQFHSAHIGGGLGGRSVRPTLMAIKKVPSESMNPLQLSGASKQHAGGEGHPVLVRNPSNSMFTPQSNAKAHNHN